MKMASKNIAIGETVPNLNELIRLANEGKSVVVRGTWGYYVKPAAFMIRWPLELLGRMEFHYSIKVK